MFIQQNEYIGDLAEAAGMRLVIHNRTYMPFPEDEGFSVMPGTITYVGLTRVRILYLYQNSVLPKKVTS